MAEFPYTPKISSLPPFFAKIQTVGVPPKVTVKYIESLGFKSKNDRYIRGILKALGFVDSSGVPTKRWHNYRDTKLARGELAAAMREAYADLFSLYPDARRKDDEALRNFFTSNTTVGEGAVQMMVSTFKTLCRLGDFESSYAPGPEQPATVVPPAQLQPSDPATAVQLAEAATTSQGITVNLNIQLTLPETKDSSIYDTIFESLKKHLLS
jgi:hypothetical protein